MGVASPCIAICVVDPRSGYCRGCLRTLKEIASWSRGDDRWKQSVIDALGTRSVTKD